MRILAGRSLLGTAMLLLAAASLSACASGDAEVSEWTPGLRFEPPDSSCIPGQQLNCFCDDGLAGIRQCLEDGQGYTECDCEFARQQRVDRCTNGSCEEAYGENCNTCPEDCGLCADCDIAPSCEHAQVPPADVPHAAEFDVPKMDWVPPEQIAQDLAQRIAQRGEGMRVLAAALDSRHLPGEHQLVSRLRQVFAQHPEVTARLRQQLQRSGMTSVAAFRDAYPVIQLSSPMQPTSNEFPLPMDCGKPMLRVAVSSITVHEEDDDMTNDIVYCVVQSEAAGGAEVRVTPKTPNLDEGDSFIYSIDEGVFWGQLEPMYAGGDIIATYDCIEADTDDGYVNLLAAIGEASMQVGGVIPGQSGWIFVVVGIVASIVAGALALDGDDHLFHAQQAILEEHHMAMTNGVYWTVRREGTHNLSDWDWELFVKAWGCAEYGTL